MFRPKAERVYSRIIQLSSRVSNSFVTFSVIPFSILSIIVNVTSLSKLWLSSLKCFSTGSSLS